MTEDFRWLAARRLGDAQALLADERWSGAYYLAGYAIECSLKACILKQIARWRMPDKKLVQDSHTHDLVDLVKIAGLEGDRAARAQKHPSFGANWNVVRDWNETSRYETRSKGDAQDLIAAISQPRMGVMAWTKKYW